MPVFRTSHGDINVSNWGYQLQGLSGAPLNSAALAALEFDLLVTDFSRDGSEAAKFTATEVAAIKADAVAVSYISIGEASEFRTFWNTAWTTNGDASGANTALAPDWLGPTNPDWPESRKVRFWDQGWQDVIFNDTTSGWLDQIVTQGFDAAYLDIVDAYYFWAAEATAAQRRPGDPVNETEAASRMIDFIVDMTAHARLTNPNFFVILQNGAFIIDALADADPVRKAALLDAIGAIAVEDVYLRNGGNPENNGFLPDEAAIAVLQRDFIANGKPVFSVDYVNQLDPLAQFLQTSIGDGFIPTVAGDRGLDRTLAPLRAINATTEKADLVAGTAGVDLILGRGGNDTIFGFQGNDRIYGGAGTDLLAGGTGNDIIVGGGGSDVISGGSGVDFLVGSAGSDVCTGGLGRDRFDFNLLSESGKTYATRDRITDFLHGSDRLDLISLDADGAAAGNNAFSWKGTAAFSRHAGELHAVKINNAGTASDRTIVEGDVNGDGRADFQIELKGLIALTAVDFIL